MRPIASLLLLISLSLGNWVMADGSPRRCLFLSSYHVGYAWSDGIEAAVYKQLQGRCELRSLYLNSKHEPRIERIQQQALQVKRLSDAWQPDVIIAADDNASKFVIQPYFHNTDTPVVFCGINWSVEEYGYPYRNATGMIEVMPIRSLLNFIQQTLPSARSGVFLSADVLSERKDYERYKKTFAQKGVRLREQLVRDLPAWERAYRTAQADDFIIVNNNAGIAGWDDERAEALVKRYSRRPSFTVYEWMMPYAMVGVTKDPAEQGEWAAKVAISVLQGGDIESIPIIPNQRWNLWRNDELIGDAGQSLPVSIQTKSRPFKYTNKKTLP